MYKVYNGDCLEVMATLEENSINTIITDPPYGINFMNKKWDHGVPGKAYWKEALRVAKPGAMLLAFGGTRTHHRLICAIEDAGWIIRDMFMWVYGSGFPKNLNIGKKLAGWEGWGTGLKPAWEPIVIAMKPKEGTFVNNAQVHGVAGFNIDGTRIELDGSVNLDQKQRQQHDNEWGGFAKSSIKSIERDKYNGYGRFPANFIHDGSDEVLDLLGDKARFFYCAKPNEKEKDAGLEDMPSRRQDEDDHVRAGTTNPRNRSQKLRKNFHPTVKPIALARYLAKLTKMPTKGTVLDMFVGSGSLGIGAILEGQDFIGIDINKESCDIASKRLEHWSKQ